MRFKANAAWKTSRSHEWRGKFSSVSANPAMKWSLKVPIAFSAAFALRACGGTSWNLMLSLLRRSLSSIDASLSMMRYFGRHPACCKSVCISVKAVVSSDDFLDFRGLAKMALESLSHITIMHLLPWLLATGN